MKSKQLFSLLGMCLFTMAAVGQSPINDTVVVTFPNDVNVGSQILPAGEYTIRQLSTATNPRLLEFATEQGTRIQASATAIPVLDNNNRNESAVIVENRGQRRFVRRIWVEGKSYGYEFPIDESDTAMAGAQSTRQTSLTARYEPAPAPAPAQEVAAAQPAAPEPTPVPQAAPNDAQPAAPEPAPAPAPQAASEPVTQAQPAAPTPAPVEAPSMPETSLNWVGMLLAGGALTSAGLMINRLRNR
jgi:predicted component of type VI protein secretion system